MLTTDDRYGHEGNAQSVRHSVPKANVELDFRAGSAVAKRVAVEAAIVAALKPSHASR